MIEQHTEYLAVEDAEKHVAKFCKKKAVIKLCQYIRGIQECEKLIEEHKKSMEEVIAKFNNGEWSEFQPDLSRGEYYDEPIR